MKVKVAVPLLKTITEWDEYTGRFQAMEEVEIRARVSGHLENVSFKDGQIVNKGDVLFIIDQRPFKIALQTAQAQFELATKELERAVPLHNSRAISQGELDRRVLEYNVTSANLERAKLDLEFTEIKSPIYGRVSRDFINVGNLITGGVAGSSLLTTVVSTNPIHFYFEANEQELLKYIRFSQTGESVNLWESATKMLVKLQDEQDYQHEGVVDFLDNRIDTGTGTIRARATFENNEGIIQPGMFGRARLQGRTDFTAMLVPDEVIGTDQSKKFVYVVNKKNEVEMRQVTLGKLHRQKFRVIESGLSLEDKVLIKKLQKVRPQMVINPVDSVIEYDQIENSATQPPIKQVDEANDTDVVSDVDHQVTEPEEAQVTQALPEMDKDIEQKAETGVQVERPNPVTTSSEY